MQDKNLELMANAPVPKAIIHLAIPTVLSSLISVVYNLTDTFFIGMLDDPIQLGAVSLAFPAFMILQAINTIFSVGAPSYISRCLGAGQYEKAKRISAVAHYGVILLSLMVTALFFLFEEPILRIMGATAENIAPTRDYLNVIMGFGFTITVQNVLPCLLRAEGKVKESATGMMIGTVVNIVLDPVFILLLHMGAAGAAWATIMGNAGACLYCMLVIRKKKTFLSIAVRDLKPERRIVMEILKIGLPSSVTNLLMSFSNVLLNNFASAYGNSAVSAVGISGKLMTVITMMIGGYVMGYLPFIGYNYGAGKMKRVRDSFWFTAVSSTAFGLILMIPFTLFGSACMGAFTSDAQIIRLGHQCLIVYVFCLPVLGLEYTVTSTFQATGKAFFAMLSNMGRQGIFFIPALMIFSRLGFWGLLWAQVAADYLAATLAIVLAIPTIRRIQKQEAISR